MQDARSSLGKRALAAVVLAVAAYVVLKLAIGVVSAIATTVALLVAVAAIVWAIRVL